MPDRLDSNPMEALDVLPVIAEHFRADYTHSRQENGIDMLYLPRKPKTQIRGYKNE